MLITFKLFIPLTGRIGSNKNPEFIIGMMAFFFTILITSLYVSIIHFLNYETM